MENGRRDRKDAAKRASSKPADVTLGSGGTLLSECKVVNGLTANRYDTCWRGMKVAVISSPEGCVSKIRMSGILRLTRTLNDTAEVWPVKHNTSPFGSGSSEGGSTRMIIPMKKQT